MDNNLPLALPNRSSGSIFPAKNKIYIIRSDFLFIKRMATAKAFESLKENLSTFLSGIVCFKLDGASVKTPHNLFGWSKKDFMARRRMKNMYWLDVFIMEMPKACMEARKLQIDIKELMNLTKMLHDDYKGLETNFAANLKSANDFLAVCYELEKELENNSNEEVKLALAYFTQRLHRDEQDERNVMINNLEYILFESDVYVPIQTRYQMRYYNLAVEQFKDKQAMEQNVIKRQIENIEDKMRKEIYCSQCAVDALYAETNKFRSRIDEMTARFARENDIIENKISYKRASMEKMRAQRTYLEEQIHRFKEEIAQLQLMEVKEAERLQRELEAKQRTAEAELLAKKENKRKQKKKK